MAETGGAASSSFARAFDGEDLAGEDLPDEAVSWFAADAVAVGCVLETERCGVDAVDEDLVRLVGAMCSAAGCGGRRGTPKDVDFAGSGSAGFASMSRAGVVTGAVSTGVALAEAIGVGARCTERDARGSAFGPCVCVGSSDLGLWGALTIADAWRALEPVFGVESEAVSVDDETLARGFSDVVTDGLASCSCSRSAFASLAR